MAALTQNIAATLGAKPGVSTKTVFGYEIAQQEPDLLARVLLDRAQQQRGLRVVCVNPHSIEVATHDAEFSQALKTADVRLCDGVGIVLAAAMFERTRLQRLTGPAFFDAMTAELARRGGSAFFLGGDPDWNERLQGTMHQKYPGLTTYMHAPPYRDRFDSADIAEMRSVIAARQPDVVWVGVGSPKQEKLMAQLHGGDFGVAAAVGAVFDFHSGRVKRAPVLVRSAGFEWLYRLVQEPQRLARRTAISAPRFLVTAARLARRKG